MIKDNSSAYFLTVSALCCCLLSFSSINITRIICLLCREFIINVDLIALAVKGFCIQAAQPENIYSWGTLDDFLQIVSCFSAYLYSLGWMQPDSLWSYHITLADAYRWKVVTLVSIIRCLIPHMSRLMWKIKIIQPLVTPAGTPCPKVLIRGWLQNVCAPLRHHGILLCFLSSPAWGSKTFSGAGKGAGKGWEVSTVHLRRRGRTWEVRQTAANTGRFLHGSWVLERCLWGFLAARIRDEPAAPFCSLEILGHLSNGLSPDLYPGRLLVLK